MATARPIESNKTSVKKQGSHPDLKKFNNRRETDLIYISMKNVIKAFQKLLNSSKPQEPQTVKSQNSGETSEGPKLL